MRMSAVIQSMGLTRVGWQEVIWSCCNVGTLVGQGAAAMASVVAVSIIGKASEQALFSGYVCAGR